MSVHTSEHDIPTHATERPITEIARTYRMDPRIEALVPGFDAPFFQAGLGGWSPAGTARRSA